MRPAIAVVVLSAVVVTWTAVADAQQKEPGDGTPEEAYAFKRDSIGRRTVTPRERTYFRIKARRIDSDEVERVTTGLTRSGGIGGTIRQKAWLTLHDGSRVEGVYEFFAVVGGTPRQLHLPAFRTWSGSELRDPAKAWKLADRSGRYPGAARPLKEDSRKIKSRRRAQAPRRH